MITGIASCTTSDQAVQDPIRRAHGPRPRRRHLAAALVPVAVLAAGLLTVPAGTASADPGLSALVDSFERVAPFRGDRSDLLPATLDTGFALGELVLDGGTSSATGTPRDGYVDYGTAAEGYRVIAASDGAGRDRVGFVIAHRDLDEFDVGIRLPDGATVQTEETGEITVRSEAGTTVLAPATAVAADGAAVAASYRIVGDALRIRVDLAGAMLPVLVDPSTTWHWWGKTEYYSRAEVNSSADWYSVVRVANLACRNLGALCSRTVGRYTGWIYNTWQGAKSSGQCLAMSMTYTGQVTSIRAYPCS